jgi:hypothetical protein
VVFALSLFSVEALALIIAKTIHDQPDGLNYKLQAQDTTVIEKSLPHALRLCREAVVYPPGFSPFAPDVGT